MTMVNCYNCLESFECETKNCWCFTLPAILEIYNNSCLCKNCLNKNIENKIASILHEYKETHTNKAIVFKDLPVFENYDYIIENGLWVFTSWYHLRRGYCCGNSCRNCPYGSSEFFSFKS